jgi:hypothetical protein
MAEVREAAPRCARCGQDGAPLVVNDSGTSLCLGCVEELGEAAEVDPTAVAMLRTLTAAERQTRSPRN